MQGARGVLHGSGGGARRKEADLGRARFTRILEARSTGLGLRVWLSLGRSPTIEDSWSWLG